MKLKFISIVLTFELGLSGSLQAAQNNLVGKTAFTGQTALVAAGPNYRRAPTQPRRTTTLSSSRKRTSIPTGGDNSINRQDDGSIGSGSGGLQDGEGRSGWIDVDSLQVKDSAPKQKSTEQLKPSGVQTNPHNLQQPQKSGWGGGVAPGTDILTGQPNQNQGPQKPGGAQTNPDSLKQPQKSGWGGGPTPGSEI